MLAEVLAEADGGSPPGSLSPIRGVLSPALAGQGSGRTRACAAPSAPRSRSRQTALRTRTDRRRCRAAPPLRRRRGSRCPRCPPARCWPTLVDPARMSRDRCITRQRHGTLAASHRNPPAHHARDAQQHHDVRNGLLQEEEHNMTSGDHMTCRH
eukprot:3900334-Rhodomonas_salina.1